MKKKYKWISVLLATAMIFLMTGCGDGSGGDAKSGTSGQSETQDKVSVSEESKVLVAYFTADENTEADAVSSASVVTVEGEEKGCVRALADMIAEDTDGELFSIQTVEKYSEDRDEVIDTASDEKEEKARPNLTSHIENLQDYDIVFVGYPNWWYDMPMAMYSFFDEYDFSGKTIIPFNSHNGSRFSNTINTIKELEPDANVIENGFTVSERSVKDASGDVSDWLSGLGF